MKKIALVSILFCCVIMLSSCTCSECNDTKEILCTFCEDGYIVCTSCEGTGRSWCHVKDCISGYTNERCPNSNCNLGKVTNPFTWEVFTCPTCNGDTRVRKDCPECDSSGRDYYDDCDNCDGEGKELCSYCGGDSKKPCSLCE